MDLETLPIVDYEIPDDGFRQLVKLVLNRIPASYEEEFPNFSIYQGSSRWGAQVDEDSVIFDVERLRRKSQGDTSALLGLIAHERDEGVRSGHRTFASPLHHRSRFLDFASRLFAWPSPCSLWSTWRLPHEKMDSP